MAADSLITPSHSISYWSNIDADVNGMLGGYPYVSRVDLQGSRNFLARLGVGPRRSSGRLSTVAEAAGGKVGRAVDCGAGIGRITTGLLLSVATTVDIVEPIAKFTAGLGDTPGVGKIHNKGLESWKPEAKYDLIWSQWCLGHLNDDQLVGFLQECRHALAPGGWIVVKENMCLLEDDAFDELDSSVTRTEQKFRDRFASAGLKIKRSELQKGFPKELYPVRMFALQPEI